MKVQQILQTKGRDVATVRKDRSVLEVVAELKERGIGAVVVVDEAGKVIGILSERDVVHALVDHAHDLTQLTAADLMTMDVETCTPDHHIDHVMYTMTHRRFRHMPVLEDGKLVGIVSIGDAVKGRIQDLEHEREALKSYIST